MIIDNFNDIKRIIFFDDDKQNIFYFVQLLLRKKDMPEKVGSNSVVIKSLYIDSWDCWKKKESFIKDLCDKTGARAYIHPMPKSYNAMTKQMLKIISDKIYNGDFQSPQLIAEKAAGTIKGDFPRWIVDLDNITEDIIAKYIHIINDNCEPIKGDKIIAQIRTKNGYHLITEPFDVLKFKVLVENNGLAIPDIHKNNPTVLYINDNMHTCK